MTTISYVCTSKYDTISALGERILMHFQFCQTVNTEYYVVVSFVVFVFTSSCERIFDIAPERDVTFNHVARVCYVLIHTQFWTRPS